MMLRSDLKRVRKNHTVFRIHRQNQPTLDCDSKNNNLSGRGLEEKIELPRLSPRQQQVLQLFANGDQPKTIAHRLGIDIRTVRGYIYSTCKRLGAKSTPHLVGVARELDLISIEVDLPEPASLENKYSWP